MKKQVHVSLYRKWRSQRFSEVLGQEHIIQTLQNVLKNRKLMSHAYLLCGPRGTGKTSVARLFAKALNCVEGPAAEPCNKCENCVRITDGSFLDVMEIDAASHTSVEMVREHIIDKVNFFPVQGKFKVYIIDEVHKLSNHSFNALLKTLEEPPSHVVFILATTHPHELLPTILSRCQRFDFRRITRQDIVRRLRLIAQEEGYPVEEGALGIIAQASEGSLRDALVLLEQAISFSEGAVTTENVVSLLGLTEESVIFNLSQLVGEEKVSMVLHLVEEIVKEGKDIFQFTKELVEHYRRLMLVNVCKDAHLILDVSEETFERLNKNARLYDAGEIVRLIKILSDLIIELKETPNERMSLEVALVKMASKRLDPSAAALKQRLDSLEKRIFEKKIEEKDDVKIVREEREKPEVTSLPAEEKKVEEPARSGDAEVWDVWPKILQAIKKEKVSLHAVLVDTKPKVVSDDTIVIEVKKGFSFHKEQVENNRKLISNVISQFLHRPVTVSVGMDEAGQEELFSNDYGEEHRKFVKDTMDIFGGRII